MFAPPPGGSADIDIEVRATTEAEETTAAGKEAITIVIGGPLALLALVGATIALALNWVGVSALERFTGRE